MWFFSCYEIVYFSLETSANIDKSAPLELPLSRTASVGKSIEKLDLTLAFTEWRVVRYLDIVPGDLKLCICNGNNNLVLYQPELEYYLGITSFSALSCFITLVFVVFIYFFCFQKWLLYGIIMLHIRYFLYSI